MIPLHNVCQWQCPWSGIAMAELLPAQGSIKNYIMANRQKRLRREKALLKQEAQVRSRFQREKQKRKEGLRPTLDIFVRTQNKSAFRRMQNRKQLQKLFVNIQLLEKRNREGHDLFIQILQHPKILLNKILVYQKLVEACGRLTPCRDLHRWKLPKSKDESVRFRSLFFHLFVKYKIPACVESVILDLLHPYYVECTKEEMMYDLVSGKGIHQVKGLGIKMNSKMNFFFHESPSTLGPVRAMWWARLRSMGLNTSVAERIVKRLYLSVSSKWRIWLDDYVFFLRRNDELSAKDFQKILDFILAQMSGRKSIRVKGIEDDIEVPALFPKFSFKGRSMASVMRFVEKWEAYIQLARESGANKEFRNSRYQSQKYIHAEGLVIIRQIKTIRDLTIEGNQMKHCVGTYTSYCISGESSIWSMRRISPSGKMKKMLTIEIDENQGELLEARGKCNRTPRRVENAFLKRWLEYNKIVYQE